jgi:hypothetical protein
MGGDGARGWRSCWFARSDQVTEFTPQYQEPPKEEPGQKGQELAAMLRPFLAWIGLRVDEDALASVITSIVVFLKAKLK